jgi:hypothetical protein
MDFHNGLVSIDATSVPVREILSEWEKIGGTKVVGADRLSGAPLTLKLMNVPEAHALETILRSAAGYMAAPRSAGTGPSVYDRILVMATSSGAVPAAASTGRPAQGPNPVQNGPQRFVPPRQQNREQPEAAEQEEPDENPPNPPVFAFPQPGNQNGANSPPGTITMPGTIGQPVNVNQGGNGQTITISPATPTNTPTMPAGSATPGVIIAPPPPPNQPGVRRPGGS